MEKEVKEKCPFCKRELEKVYSNKKGNRVSVCLHCDQMVVLENEKHQKMKFGVLGA